MPGNPLSLIFCIYFFSSVVLFPFLTPIYEMLNLSIFPRDSMNFFKKFVKRMKKERLASKQKVNGTLLSWCSGLGHDAQGLVMMFRVWSWFLGFGHDAHSLAGHDAQGLAMISRMWSWCSRFGHYTQGLIMMLRVWSWYSGYGYVSGSQCVIYVLSFAFS